MKEDLNIYDLFKNYNGEKFHTEELDWVTLKEMKSGNSSNFKHTFFTLLI